jgi:hypothetical protein
MARVYWRVNRRRFWLTLLAYLFFATALPSTNPLGAESHKEQANLHQAERKQKHSNRSFGPTVINPPPSEEAAPATASENNNSDENDTSKL